jgi:nucleoside-diphosphate-sugar epimerase
MSRILIFGSNGFLGSSLRHTLAIDHDVSTVNRNPRPGARNFFGDILEPKSYYDIIKTIKPNIVISTAWNTTQNFWENSQNFAYSKATIDLARTAYSLGTDRFIGFGSSAEFEELIQNRNSESTTLRSQNVYGQAKSITGLAIAELSRSYEKQFNWLRIFQAYGENEKSDRLIPQALSSLSLERPIILQNPARELDWIYSGDVSSSVEYIISNEIKDNFIDVGTSVGTTVLQLVRQIAWLLSVSESLVTVSPSSLENSVSRLVCPSNSPLFRHGWKPKMNLQNGLQKLIAT